MPQVFSRRANFITKFTIFGGLIGLSALYGVCNQIQRSPISTGNRIPVEQPIPFSHQLHVGVAGIDCRYCHQSVDVSNMAGIPPTETCMNCHDKIQTDSPNVQPILESWQTGVPIKWNRVHDLGDYVFFNHSIHVNKGVGCQTCHGQVDQMPVVYAENQLRMEWCLECHRNPQRYLRPVEEVYSMDYEQPPDQNALGEQLVRDYHIPGPDLLTSCSTCHR